MWMLDRGRFALELERQGLTLEEVVDTAHLRRADRDLVANPEARVSDPSILGHLAAALGVEPFDISCSCEPEGS
jgi:hypothetical protein